MGRWAVEEKSEYRLSRESFLFGAPLITEDPDDGLLALTSRSSSSLDARDDHSSSPGSGDEPG